MFTHRHRIVIPTILAFLLVSMPFATPAVSAAEVVAAAVGSADLRAVTFVNATTGYAAADNGGIFKTTNGGDSWTQVRAADSYSFRGIDFWDASNLVAVDYAGKVASSTNGGNTWTNVSFTPNPDMDPPSTSLAHNDVATKRGTDDAIVAAGDDAPGDDTWMGGTSMRTTSTLAYWRSPFSDTTPHLYYNAGSESWENVGRGEFLDVEYVTGTTTVWASGIDYWTLDASNPQKYPLFKSTDEGVTWAGISGFGTLDLRLEGVAFGSSTAGIIVGQVVGGSRVARYTTNGGTTWTPSATLPGTSALNAVDMSSPTLGWAVGADGGILRTTNGGADWTACTITGGNAYPLYDVTFVPGTTTGWAVGAAGTMLLTTDGSTWRAPGPPVNQSPVAVADSYTTAEDTPKVVAAPGVLANDTDAEGNPLTAIKVTNPANGAVTLNSNGSFTYTPSANWSGIDSFTYKANDGTSDSNVVTVTIAVTAVNDAPVAVTNSYTTIADEVLTVAAPGVLGNDTDLEGNPLTAIKVSNPGHGAVAFNSNGSFTYTPTAGYSGPDSFTYKANDGTSDSNVVTVNLTVTPAGSLVEETDARMAQAGPWATWMSSSLSGGSYTYANAAGASTTISFDGASLALLARTGPEFGIAAVAIDGGTATDVSLYSSTTRFQHVVFATQDLTPGPHTITVSWTGRKAHSDSGTYINIDAARIALASPPALEGTLVQQDSTFVQRAGSWPTFAHPSFSGGSYAYTNTAGSSARVSFTGTRLDLIARTGPEFGFARVTVDGASRYIDLYSASTSYQQLVFSTWDMPTGPHTVQVEWTGRKNPASSGTYVNVDAFEIAGTPVQPPMLYQETDAAFDLQGAWGAWSSPALSGGSYVYSNANAASANISFSGSSISVYGRKGPEFGTASVSLDGAAPTTIDLYSPTTAYGQLLHTVTTSAGLHTLSITRTGEMNPAATGSYINLDSAEVVSASPPTITGPTVMQQDDPRLATSGTWGAYSHPSLSGGTYAYTNSADAQATALFFGTQLELYARTGPEFGYAKVTLDGTRVYYVDLYTQDARYQQRVFSTWPLSSGPHTVRIEWSGRKNPSASGSYVNVDSLQIAGSLPSTGVIRQETDMAVTGPWASWSGTLLSGGAYRYLNTAGSASLAVSNATGEHGAFTLIARTGPEFGIARVKVGDTYVGEVSLYSPTTRWQQEVFTWPLAPGTYPVSVEWTGRKHPLSSNTYVNVDAVDVWIPATN